MKWPLYTLGKKCNSFIRDEDVGVVVTGTSKGDCEYLKKGKIILPSGLELQSEGMCGGGIVLGPCVDLEPHPASTRELSRDLK